MFFRGDFLSLLTIAWLLILSAASGVADEVSLDNELRDAQARVWIAHQQWLVAGAGPGVNRINRVNPPLPRGGDDEREQLREAARRTLDAAKTVVDELEARLAANEANIAAASELNQRIDVLPGDVTLRWNPVPGAASYTVEINVIGRGTDGAWSLWSYVVNLDSPEYTLELGSGPSRWRVWGVDATGMGGPVGAWSEIVPPPAAR